MCALQPWPSSFLVSLCGPDSVRKPHSRNHGTRSIVHFPCVYFPGVRPIDVNPEVLDTVVMIWSDKTPRWLNYAAGLFQTRLSHNQEIPWWEDEAEVFLPYERQINEVVPPEHQ